MTSFAGCLDALVPLLWRATWQAALLIALVFALRGLLGRRLSPAWRFALWGVVLARLLVPVLPAGPLSLFRVPAAIGSFLEDDERVPAPRPATILATGYDPITPPASFRFTKAADPIDLRVTEPAADSPWTPVRVTGLIWLGGAVLLSARTALALARLRRSRRGWQPIEDPALLALCHACRETMGVRFSVGFRMTGDDLGPAVTGLWRPCVLIPRSVLASASREDLEHILLHELAHIRRRDVAVHWLMTLACVLHWFNPASWLAAAQMQTDRELACDDSVLRRLGRARRSAYGETILRLAARFASPRPLPGMVGAFGPRRQLQERILMIAHDTPLKRAWSLVAAGLLLGLAVAGLTDADEPPAPERVAELIKALRATKIQGIVEGEGKWASAIRDLARIGRPAVPALIEELDRTTDSMPMRAIGFTLRAIGDPRSVPALIRAIPRTLVPDSQDYGLTIKDPELFSFMKRHEIDLSFLVQQVVGKEELDPTTFGFSSPFHEITDALHAITGQRFNEEELLFMSLEGGPDQHRLVRKHVQQLAERWAGWWQKNGRRFTDDPAYAGVNLAALVEAPRAASRPGQPFPTGPKVRDAGRGSWSNIIIGPPQSLAFYRTFHDLDSMRQSKWPDELPAPKKAKADAATAWGAKEGFDLVGIEYRPPGSDRSYHALQGLGLRAWQVENERYDSIESELWNGQPPALGRPAGDLLMDFDPQTRAYHPEKVATFLFVTREGAAGILQVTGLVTELYRPSDIGKPDSPETKHRGFFRGVQFQYKLFFEGGDEDREGP